MWQALLAAALAGTTSIAAKHIISAKNPTTTEEQKNFDKDQNFAPDHRQIDLRFQFPLPDEFENHGCVGNCEANDGIFRFFSSGSKSNGGLKKLRKKGAKIVNISCGVELRKSAKRVPGCLKKRKVVKNGTANGDSNDGSLFSWGLGVGMMCMMSGGRAEIGKLNAAVDEAAKVVHDLKTELSKRNSLEDVQRSKPANVDLFTSTSGIKHTQPALNQTRNRSTDSNALSFYDPAVSEDGEYASSVLTEEREPELDVSMMNQLEAELQSELQKFPVCTNGGCQRKMNPNMSEAKCQGINCHESAGKLHDPHQFNGVSPFELDNKLCHLILDQQEHQIANLENELHSAHSKLHQKEAELQALKDCVKRLTEFSLSPNSDEETDAQESFEGAHEWGYPEMESESQITVVGAKRPINNEL